MFCGTFDAGLHRTADGGETWTYPQAGLDTGTAGVSPPTLRVLVSAARSARVAHTVDSAEAYLYRREGDGQWDRIGAGIPTGSGVVPSDN